MASEYPIKSIGSSIVGSANLTFRNLPETFRDNLVSEVEVPAQVSVPHIAVPQSEPLVVDTKSMELIVDEKSVA